MRTKKALQCRRCLRRFMFKHFTSHIILEEIDGKVMCPTAHSTRHRFPKTIRFGALATYSSQSLTFWSPFGPNPLRTGIRFTTSGTPGGRTWWCLPPSAANHCFLSVASCCAIEIVSNLPTTGWSTARSGFNNLVILRHNSPEHLGYNFIAIHVHQSHHALIDDQGSRVWHFTFQPWSSTTFGLLPMAASCAERVALLKERWLRGGGEEYRVTTCASWGSWWYPSKITLVENQCWSNFDICKIYSIVSTMITTTTNPKTVIQTSLAQEFYKDLLDQDDFVLVRRQILKKRLGLSSKDSRVALLQLK